MQMRRRQTSSAVWAERTVSLILGAALLALAWRRRPPGGIVAGLAGAAFTLHGATRGRQFGAVLALRMRERNVVLREPVSYETGEPIAAAERLEHRGS